MSLQEYLSTYKSTIIYLRNNSYCPNINSLTLSLLGIPDFENKQNVNNCQLIKLLHHQFLRT